MMEQFPLNNAVNVSHLLLLPYVATAKVLVDMTCGNGHDTVFLASHMDKAADLYAFDIQECALEQTRQRIAEAGLAHKNLHYALGSHDKLVERLEVFPDVVLFNLGYLPSGDHTVHTEKKITIDACKICLNKIAINGIIMIAAYPGTAPGAEEQQAVHEFLRTLSQKQYHVSLWQPLNQIHEPPVLYSIQKRG